MRPQRQPKTAQAILSVSQMRASVFIQLAKGQRIERASRINLPIPEQIHALFNQLPNSNARSVREHCVDLTSAFHREAQTTQTSADGRPVARTQTEFQMIHPIRQPTQSPFKKLPL